MNDLPRSDTSASKPISPPAVGDYGPRIEWLASHLDFLRKAMPVEQRVWGGLKQGVLSAAAAILAYVPTDLLDLHQGFWGAITTVAIMQTEYKPTRRTATDQFAGAAIGGVIALGALFLPEHGLTTYGLAVLLSLLACWTLNVASAARLAGITATIILLVPHTGTPLGLVLRRVSEVGWGICVAVTIAWIVEWVRSR